MYGFFSASDILPQISPAFFVTSVTLLASRLCSLMMFSRLAFSQSMYALSDRFGAFSSLTFLTFRDFFSSFGDFLIAFWIFGLLAGDFFADFIGDFFGVPAFTGVFFGVPAM